MKRAVLGFVAVMLCALPAHAQPAQPKSKTAAEIELERKFRTDVERVSAAAADAFDQGNAARDAHRLDEALAAYRRAIELAPAVDHPHRRACSVLAMQHHIDEGLVECEAALKLAPDSPYNKSQIVKLFSVRDAPGDLQRARQLAHQAAKQLPDDARVVEAWCALLVRRRIDVEAQSCVERLIALDPNGVGANYLSSMVAISKHQFYWARKKLDDARAAGLDDPDYRGMLALIAAEEKHVEDQRKSQEDPLTLPSAEFLWSVLWFFIGWFAGIAILLVAGNILSQSTLRSITSVTSADAGAGTPRERRLRQLYKVVLWLSGLYFYLSIPFLLMSIIIAGCGVFYFFLAQDAAPIYLLFLVGAAVVGTIGAILRGAFVKLEHGPLGHRVDLDHQPRLRALIEDVAKAVGTRPAAAVFLTPGTEMAVTEFAALWQSLRGKRAERSLIMGVGLFDGMTQIQLRAVLAHEHGHFRNDDTAGGGFAMQVRQSLLAMFGQLKKARANTVFNPVWWILRVYWRVYSGVSQGASRLQEVLADRWAIHAYGTAGFVEGYRHVITRKVQFTRDADATINEVVKTGSPLPNLYQYRRQSSEPADGRYAAAIEKELTREPTAYDSHPSSRQRIAWAEALAVKREAQPGDDEPIWSLFDGREDLERTMTTVVRERILAKLGHTIVETQEQADDHEHLEADKRTIAALAAHGDLLTKPRSVQHWIDFSTTRDRDSFIAEVTNEGFSAELTQGEEADTFGVTLSRIDRVDLEAIHKVVMSLVAISKRHSGDYDGWESAVEKR